MAKDISLATLGEFAIVFGMIWIGWLNGTPYYELHGRERMRGRIPRPLRQSYEFERRCATTSNLFLPMSLSAKESIPTAPELSAERLAELTSLFVSVPSVNGEHFERELAMVIASELESGDFETKMVGSDRRPSLGVRGGGEANVVLNGHLDTVPVDDESLWRFDPYQGVIVDGAVHGRGACDMKGGLAIQVAVAQWLDSQGMTDGLVLHFAMGEERGEPGTEDLLAAGYVAPRGIVLEPTNLHLGIAQRGMFTLRITINGRAGHASRPELTENPLELLPSVLAVIDRLGLESAASHPLLGEPQWTPTMIHSGVIPSMVPGGCVIHVDRRMIPGETVEDIVAKVRSALAAADLKSPVEVAVAEEEGIYDAAEIDSEAKTVALMTEALESQGEQLRIFGTPYSSDIRHLINSSGIEAVTYGPGRATEMHARDEHIKVDDLTRAARVVAAFCLRAIDSD